MSHKLDVDGGTRETVPRGKIINIGSDEIEVWPWQCVDGYRCIQCFFMGKTGCAPRFWLPRVRISEAHPTFHPESSARVELLGIVFSLDKVLPSGEDTLYELFAAQPVEPLNDGGFTEETTWWINNRAGQLYRNREPYRITDEPCPKCGYQYPVSGGTRGVKQRYHCLRCGKYWTPGALRIPPGMKDFARNLRFEGLSLSAIVRQVAEVYHKKISKNSIHEWTKGENKEGGRSERDTNNIPARDNKEYP